MPSMVRRPASDIWRFEENKKKMNFMENW